MLAWWGLLYHTLPHCFVVEYPIGSIHALLCALCSEVGIYAWGFAHGLKGCLGLDLLGWASSWGCWHGSHFVWLALLSNTSHHCIFLSAAHWACHHFIPTMVWSIIWPISCILLFLLLFLFVSLHSTFHNFYLFSIDLLHADHLGLFPRLLLPFSSLFNWQSHDLLLSFGFFVDDV